MRVVRTSSWVLVTLLTLLPTLSFAGPKRIDGLEFESVKLPGLSCANVSFYIIQEPDSFFKDLKETKDHGAVKFLRGNSVVEAFPDELRFRVIYARNVAQFNPCSTIGAAFNPAMVKFRATWQNAHQTKIAQGTVVQTEWLDPGPWCEDSCGGAWVYELRIDSEKVSLANQLAITIDSDDGTHLAEFMGGLGQASAQQAISPAPAP